MLSFVGRVYILAGTTTISWGTGGCARRIAQLMLSDADCLVMLGFVGRAYILAGTTGVMSVLTKGSQMSETNRVNHPNLLIIIIINIADTTTV
jgi:hypothetical protein